MPKPSHREKILTEGLRVVHERGFAGASVRDIVQAAGVPQGSFTNHFTSKEAFGLEVLDLYFARGSELLRETPRNDAPPPLPAPRRLYRCDQGPSQSKRHAKRLPLRQFHGRGERPQRNPPAASGRNIRRSAGVRRLLPEGGERGRGLSPSLDCDEVAAFIVASLQGANLLAKAQRSPLPVERFKQILFSTVLR